MQYRWLPMVLGLACGAGGSAAAAEPPLVFACQPPFTGEMTAQSLAAAFGEENLQSGQAVDMEGEPFEATIIYPDSQQRRLVVAWANEDEHRNPESISVLGESDWVGPLGLRFGMGLEEVERLNGERFELYGFGWDYGGRAEILSGKLVSPVGECRLELSFDPAPGAPFTEVIGEVLFWSDDPAMRASRPRVYEMRLRFVGPVED